MIKSSPTLTREKDLIVDSSPKNNAVLENWFSTNHEFEVIGTFLTPQAALSAPETAPPDLALIGIDVPNGINFCKMLRKQNPAILIIALISTLDANMEISIRQSGAVASLLREAGKDQIDMAIQAATSLRGVALCSIIGLGGIKEGTGTTLQTAILGDFIGNILPGKVLIIDLDFLRADLAFSLGIQSQNSIQELLSKDNFLDFDVLQSHIIRTNRGFSILPAAQDQGLKYVSDIAIVGLITVLGNFFEVILIDLPTYPFHGLNGVTDVCDKIIINTGETPNHIKSLFWVISTGFKTMPRDLLKKLIFSSWCNEPEIKNEIARQIPECVFLPKPHNARLNEPEFTINDTNEFKPLRVALKSLVDKIPSILLPNSKDVETSTTNKSPLSLISRLGDFLRGK